MKWIVIKEAETIKSKNFKDYNFVNYSKSNKFLANLN